MRLSIKMLSRNSSINSMSYTPNVQFERGESLDLMFQLIDADSGQRYIPASGATIQVQIPRNNTLLQTASTEVDTVNYSVNQAAVMAFTGDNSVWKTPLVATQTKNMTSQNIRILLTEGSETKIAVVKYAIVVGSERE